MLTKHEWDRGNIIETDFNSNDTGISNTYNDWHLSTPTCYSMHIIRLGGFLKAILKACKNSTWGSNLSTQLHRQQTVHSPLFFRKIIEIERFALRAAIFHEYQNYLGGRGRFA